MGGWGVWLPNWPKNPQISPKNAFLTRISPFVFPNLTKTLGWVGVFKDLGKFSQIKPFFLGTFPKVRMTFESSFLYKFNCLNFALLWPTGTVKHLPVISCLWTNFSLVQKTWTGFFTAHVMLNWIFDPVWHWSNGREVLEQNGLSCSSPAGTRLSHSNNPGPEMHPLVHPPLLSNA